MIWPGVKRPPPMGSELVRPGALLEGVRPERPGVGEEEGLRGVVGGAMVAWSALKSFESMVAAVLRSKAPPQTEQNLPLEEACSPQEVQNMEGEILSLQREPRRLGRGLLGLSGRSQLRNAFDLDGGAVLHDFGSLVAHGDDGVCAVLGGMLKEQLVGIFASFLAKVGQDGDVAANDSLKRGAEISDHATRAHDDAADYPEIANNAIAGEFESRRHHARVHTIGHFCSP